MLELNDKLKEKIKKGGFGLERECIRVDEKCLLSSKMHPECFGNKLIKKHITTDFSESQIEMITPVMSSVDNVYEYADRLYDYVCSNIGDEYLWCQSMPCIIGENIPVALYEGEKGREATEYREMLVRRYGGERQLISGIHFNFSFSDEFLKGLYDKYGNGQEYRLFVDKVYLKVTRNYIRYGFLITYLCGCSNICHKTFDKNCIETLKKRDDSTYWTPSGVSLRNSKWGYRNLIDLFPDYSSAKSYVDSIYRFIEEGKISYAKEFYSSIRLKGSSMDIRALAEKGIKYIELRTIDINPFDKVGVNLWDLKFIHLFLLLMLIMDENCDAEYQKDGQNAKEEIALCGIDSKIKICGREWMAKDKCVELINTARELNNELGLYDDEIIDFQMEKVLKGGYAFMNDKMDFLSGSMDLMKHYKIAAVLGAMGLTQEQIEEIME